METLRRSSAQKGAATLSKPLPAISHAKTTKLPPFMRAALVIDVDPSAVTASAIKPARFYTNYKDGQLSHRVEPQLSPTWVVPTRHPEALNAALRAAPDNWDFANGH